MRHSLNEAKLARACAITYAEFVENLLQVPLSRTFCQADVI